MSSTITIPHNYQPRSYQTRILKALDSGLKRAVIVWHRRSGKDKTLLNLTIKKMLERVGSYYYFFPTYAQGKKILWDGVDGDGFPFMKHFPDALVVSRNDTELKIKLKNGSIFQIVGTDKIDSIVGTNPVGCVFSEYSLQNPEAWGFIRPILAENGGWAVFNFTPRGMNHGWQILQLAKQSADWFWEVLSVEDTKAISKEVLENERKEMPQDLFEQEYHCKFIDGANAFFRRIDENLWDGNLEYEPSHVYKLGVDLAKHQDWTVITSVDLNTFRVGKQDRFNQIDWNLQKARIESTYHRFSASQVTVDSTGVGDPIADDLTNRGLSVEPYRFTEQSREALLKNLAILLEQDRIKIPNDETLLSELRSMRYELTERGKLKLQVPSGTHDDCVMSLALAVWGLTLPLGNMEYSVEFYTKQNFN